MKSAGQSRMKRNGTTLILRGGQKRILSIDADSAYEETHITCIEFNRCAEVAAVRVFEKDQYSTMLKKEIKAQISSNDELMDTTKEKSKKRDEETGEKRDKTTEEDILDTVDSL